jgi:hypothetical protein
MTDQVLDILKLVLLALLYLFFARVLWAVWSEVRQPAGERAGSTAERSAGERATATPAFVPEGTPSGGTAANWRAKPAARATKPPRGKRGVPARMVILEPKERRGEAFVVAATAPVTIGRDGDNTVVVADDTYVSGRHATVAVADGVPGGAVVVDDLGSKNGTYVNGTRIAQRRTLHIGDRVQTGTLVLEAQ